MVFKCQLKSARLGLDLRWCGCCCWHFPLQPRNWEGSGRKDIQHKNTLGCMAVITLTLICEAAVVIQCVRGDQQLTKSLIKSRIRRVYRKCGFLSSGSSCFFQLFPRVLLSIRP